MGMRSSDILGQMGLGDRFGQNKRGEYGFWTKNTFDASGYKAQQFDGALETVVVGSNKHWVSYNSFGPQGDGINFSLAALYRHFQTGEGKTMTIIGSSIDFSETNQRELGLDKLKIGQRLNPVNLFIEVGI